MNRKDYIYNCIEKGIMPDITPETNEEESLMKLAAGIVNGGGSGGGNNNLLSITIYGAHEGGNDSLACNMSFDDIINIIKNREVFSMSAVFHEISPYDDEYYISQGFVPLQISFLNIGYDDDDNMVDVSIAFVHTETLFNSVTITKDGYHIERKTN